MRDRILDVINLEIGFHSEVTNPWYWRAICKIFGKKECHEVLVHELKYIKGYIDREPIRICADCGKEYEPMDATDWWCKKCLTKRFNDLRAFGIDYARILMELKKESEMTPNGPGGS